MASNQVGHYIYHLKDRIWPDFICHFNLFKGSGHFLSSFDWSADCEMHEIASRSPPSVRANLDFLKKSARLDNSSA